MQNPRLAARYAKSLMDIAIENSKLDTMYHDMLGLDAICNESKDFVSMMKSPIVAASTKQNVIKAIIEGKVELSLSDQDGYKKVLGHLAQGEIFGEKASLLSGQLSDVNVKALEDIEVLRVDITTLQHLLQDNPILASKLGEMMELRRKSVKAHFETV